MNSTTSDVAMFNALHWKIRTTNPHCFVSEFEQWFEHSKDNAYRQIEFEKMSKSMVSWISHST